MKKTILLAILYLMIAPAVLHSQSLDDLISMAQANSAKVRAMNTDYEAATKVAGQVDAYPDPEISVGLGVLPVETRLGPQQVRLGVSQMIPWPGMLNAKRELAIAMAEVKSLNAENYMIEVAYSIKKAYYTIFAIRQKAVLLQEKIDLLNSLKEIATTRIESGKARLSDILYIESRIIEYSGQIQSLQQAEYKPTTIINAFTYRPLDTRIEVVGDMGLVDEVAYSEEYIHQLHPELKKMDHMKTVSERIVALTEYQSKPRIGVGLDYILVGQRGDASPDHNGRDIFMPMGRISIPLNKGQYQSKREEEKLKMAAIDQYKEDFTQMIRSEIGIAFNNIATARIDYEWNNKIIANNLTTIDLIQTAYTASNANMDELLMLYNDNIKYEMAKVDAIKESLIAKANIEKYQIKK
jgi:outer membrane protein TolC